MTKEKMTIVNEMIDNGYNLFDETPEHFAARFDIDILKIFRDNFLKWKSE